MSPHNKSLFSPPKTMIKTLNGSKKDQQNIGQLCINLNSWCLYLFLLDCVGFWKWGLISNGCLNRQLLFCFRESDLENTFYECIILICYFQRKKNVSIIYKSAGRISIVARMKYAEENHCKIHIFFIWVTSFFVNN